MASLELVISLPKCDLSPAYFACRYACLREPLGFPVGSERLKDDAEAIHAWWETTGGEIVAVGRIHRISIDYRGGGSKHTTPIAATCPEFSPLIDDDELQPSVQIRQMGTRPAWRRQGLASGLVLALEAAAISHWGAKSGWLQARINAIPMYESEGWIQFGDEYEVSGIGPHFSMWKKFDGED